MDKERFDAALQGLRRLAYADAIRASEHLEIAVDHSKDRTKRWAEQMCYSLRECLEAVPSLFGQKKAARPLRTMARQFSTDISEAIAVNHPPDVIYRLISNFEEELEIAERTRHYRVAQAMMTQAGVREVVP